MKSGGILELIYYTNLSEGLSEACVDELAAFEGYQYKSYFEEDPEWKDYFEFLFPDPYSYQSMQNRKVVMQLEENGDNLDAPREIDHWIYFDNEQSRAEYVEKVIRKGYKVVSEDFIEEGDSYHFQLHIVRQDCPHEIDEIVWELKELADNYDAYYDGWESMIVK